MRIGVLALQGTFREHIYKLRELGVEACEIKKQNQIDYIDGLIIPGGESTSIGKLMNNYHLFDKIICKGNEGLPVLGTCAGCILLAKELDKNDMPRLGLMDISVIRSGFGRQVDSFEIDLDIPVLGNIPFKAVFIRAPYIDKIKPNVGIMAELDDKIVMVRQGNYLACSFNPELTSDMRIHQYFIDMVDDCQEST